MVSLLSMKEEGRTIVMLEALKDVVATQGRKVYVLSPGLSLLSPSLRLSSLLLVLFPCPLTKSSSLPAFSVPLSLPFPPFSIAHFH